MFSSIMKLELQMMDLDFNYLWPMIEDDIADIDFADDPKQEEDKWLDKIISWQYCLDNKMPINLNRFPGEKSKAWLDRCYKVSNYGNM